MKIETGRRSGRRGSGLIEVLVAFAILCLMIAGALQIFSLTLAQSYGASARTQLTYRCQQVVEMLRLSQYLVRNGQTALTTNYGIPTLSAVAGAGPQPLPYDASDPPALWNSWGPKGANIIEQPNDAYRIFYVVENVNGGGWQVRVSALPVNSPDLPTALKPSNVQQRYMGKLSVLKKVEYVAQITPTS